MRTDDSKFKGKKFTEASEGSYQSKFRDPFQPTVICGLIYGSETYCPILVGFDTAQHFFFFFSFDDEFSDIHNR